MFAVIKISAALKPVSWVEQNHTYFIKSEHKRPESPHSKSFPLTFPVVEVEFDGLALVDVQVGEPDGGGEQDQQQQELELLSDLLHGEAQHPGSLILR